MQFQPKTEAEIKAANLLPEGVYDFEVFDAVDKVSKSGNGMIELHLKVFSDDGRTRQMRDWILPAFERKLRHFCEACGLMAQYEAGTLNAEDCIGMAGKVQLVQQTREGYDPQNSVRDYIVPEAGSVPTRSTVAAPKPAAAPAHAVHGEDDIPF